MDFSKSGLVPPKSNTFRILWITFTVLKGQAFKHLWGKTFFTLPKAYNARPFHTVLVLLNYVPIQGYTIKAQGLTSLCKTNRESHLGA